MEPFSLGGPKKNMQKILKHYIHYNEPFKPPKRGMSGVKSHIPLSKELVLLLLACMRI